MNPKKKKGLLIGLLVLAFLIPIAVAALFLRQNMDSDLNKGNVLSVLLVHGEEQDEVTGEEEIRFFVSAATGGAPIGEAVHDLSQYRKLEVTFKKYNNEFVYQFYLSDSDHDCVYTDPEGNLFLFPQDVAKKLQSHWLLRDYALSFAEYPSLKLEQGGEEYLPCKEEGEWNFVRADGEKEQQKVSKTAENKAVLPQGEKFNCAFAIEPDYCSVLISVKDGELLYSGVYSEMPMLHLEEDTMLTATVSCDWYEKEELEYNGSIVYTFELFYDVPTLCKLDQSQVVAGDSFVLAVANSSSEEIAVNPGFAAGQVNIIKMGGIFVATIPVSADAVPGNYTIVVMGSDVEETIPVTVLSAQ